MPEAPVSTRTFPDAYSTAAPAVDAIAAIPHGNWATFIGGLNLSGMAGMLAKQCELQSFDNGVLELVLPGAQKHLADKTYQDKLKSELMPHLGTNLRLNIRFGDVAGASLAAHEDRTRSQRQADAEAAIADDPFIKNLKQEFGADVIRESIRPANAQ